MSQFIYFSVGAHSNFQKHTYKYVSSRFLYTGALLSRNPWDSI